VTSYDKLKEGLLKRFKLSEGGYRSRFKKSRLENGETPEQFVERIRKYLRKWREMANFEETYRERSVLLDMSKRLTNIPERAGQIGSEANDRKIDELYRSALS